MRQAAARAEAAEAEVSARLGTTAGETARIAGKLAMAETKIAELADENIDLTERLVESIRRTDALEIELAAVEGENTKLAGRLAALEAEKEAR